MHWSNSLYVIIPCLQILQLADASAFGSLDKVNALNNVGQHFAATKKVGHHLLKRMHPGPHDLAPLNDEIDGCNLLRRFNDPDRPNWAQLTLWTLLSLFSSCLMVLCVLGSARQHPQFMTVDSVVDIVLTLLVSCLAFATAYILWSLARAFRSTRPRIDVDPAPVLMEAPDLEDQLPQANGGQVPIHVNDEAHHAGTAGIGVNAVAPQHESQVQFPRGGISLAGETPPFHPSSSYAQDIHSDESNSRDGHHSQGSSPTQHAQYNGVSSQLRYHVPLASSHPHNSVSPGPLMVILTQARAIVAVSLLRDDTSFSVSLTC
ncbi:hypothetical protein SeLEV6574_g02267 [Synchytrium endobioticum]|uniref:MARVEL domain-containing protein n=1 Tax=Synchytrium endobioticum TaxID=286115 RepID=A0A507D9I6_9FUNG|nr:hypothetical protein SeLEV6574_g02267 [Synchytrium endobioticum]